MRVLAAAVTILCVAAIARGYSTGAPPEACADMVPQHQTAPQTSPSPYVVSVDRKSIKAGDSVKVIIAPKSGAGAIKGFFVQGRVGDTPVGQFAKTSVVTPVNCGSGVGNAATHHDSKDKPKVELTWTAPKGLSETVVFRVTVVKNGGTFWVGQTSEPVSVN